MQSAMLGPPLRRGLAVRGVGLDSTHAADFFAAPARQVDAFRTSSRIDCISLVDGNVDGVVGAISNADAA
ncbi:MAG: hypothetical protein ACM3S0_09980 [Acidobacteriota bacterium]